MKRYSNECAAFHIGRGGKDYKEGHIEFLGNNPSDSGFTRSGHTDKHYVLLLIDKISINTLNFGNIKFFTDIVA